MANNHGMTAAQSHANSSMLNSDDLRKSETPVFGQNSIYPTNNSILNDSGFTRDKQLDNNVLAASFGPSTTPPAFGGLQTAAGPSTSSVAPL